MFTDDDLKQMKEFMADDIVIGTPKLQRLLARLEAAEKLIAAYIDMAWKPTVESETEIEDATEAWHKAKGK